ncbi:hypothetical protein L873DRAFT_1795924 [Choiromyces venosus 120613-1]|uniref:Uncharacterized protein n=1 Tax=Choiromyces venosus 120613-1 TaxID=1336337 RepID=A0A3N4IV53_9PEZI|nr:hypothetical protein L873DRAFT_1795924 [Choiromyces venosus 120613-1]
MWCQIWTMLLLMPEDVSQATEKLATLSSANDDDVIKITAKEFDATFPLWQWSSTQFGRDIEVVKATTKLVPQHQQNDEEVHVEIPDDEDGSDSQDPNADHGVLAGDESGRQNEDIQDEEGITEDDQNQEEQDHSLLLSPNSEPEPREIDDVDHGIMTAPNPLLDQSSLTSGQLDHDGDTTMMDAGSLAMTSAAHAAESESMRSVSVDLEHKKRELDMHHHYAPANPSNGLLTTCFHSVAQQCLLQDQWLYLQAVHSHPERSHQLVAYPCLTLYIATGTVPPPQFRNVNQEWDLEDAEMYLKQTVIRVALSDNNYVLGEAIAGVASRDYCGCCRSRLTRPMGAASGGGFRRCEPRLGNMTKWVRTGQQWPSRECVDLAGSGDTASDDLPGAGTTAHITGTAAKDTTVY